MHTSAVDERAIAKNEMDKAAERARWQTIIDEKLIEWGADPIQSDDDGTCPPSREAISCAVALAVAFRDKGFLAPTKVVPTGDGGIVFERRPNNLYERIEVQSDREIIHSVYKDCVLLSRETISLIDN